MLELVLKKLNFLIVDDEEDILDIFEMSLKAKGHSVQSVTNMKSEIAYLAEKLLMEKFRKISVEGNFTIIAEGAGMRFASIAEYD